MHDRPRRSARELSGGLITRGFVCSWTAGGARAPFMQHSIISSVRSVVGRHETTKMKFEKEKISTRPFMALGEAKSSRGIEGGGAPGA
eukprot:2999518-Pyramimonas_sp.AAC.1